MTPAIITLITTLAPMVFQLVQKMKPESGRGPERMADTMDVLTTAAKAVLGSELAKDDRLKAALEVLLAVTKQNPGWAEKQLPPSSAPTPAKIDEMRGRKFLVQFVEEIA